MKRSYAEAVDAATSVSSDGPFVAFTTTKLVREHHELRIRHGFGETIGQQVDSAIGAALENHDELQELRFEFSPEAWRALREGNS